MLEEFFGIPYLASIVVISVITAIYTILGGLKAVMITDAFQAVLLLLGAAILTYAGLQALPGVGIHTWAEFKAACRPDQLSMVQPIRDAHRAGQPGIARVLLVFDPLRLPGARDLVLVHGPDHRAEDPGRQDRKRRPRRSGLRRLPEDPPRVPDGPAGRDRLRVVQREDRNR